jgi:hypothetical protein
METISVVLNMLNEIKTPPEFLTRKIELLRKDMEQSSSSSSSGYRSFGLSQQSSAATPSQRPASANCWRSSPFSGKPSTNTNSNGSIYSSGSSPMKYQSKFVKQSESLDDKILNTVIGNKLNAFTPVTYNDTRDFIYQIIDSGETEFIKDFVEKVFMKATLEELYCSLFARLIAEIAHKYPIIYVEMQRYHTEFLKVFDSVTETATSPETIKQRQYRLGYGHFISELAGLNALDKEHLLAMITKVKDMIVCFSVQTDKNRSVEELIDCLIRLSKSLKEKSPTFFEKNRNDMKNRILDDIHSMIDKTIVRPSLSSKARFGLMDLRDILVE